MFRSRLTPKSDQVFIMLYCIVLYCIVLYCKQPDKQYQRKSRRFFLFGTFCDWWKISPFPELRLCTIFILQPHREKGIPLQFSITHRLNLTSNHFTRQISLFPKHVIFFYLSEIETSSLYHLPCILPAFP